MQGTGRPIERISRAAGDRRAETGLRGERRFPAVARALLRYRSENECASAPLGACSRRVQMWLPVRIGHVLSRAVSAEHSALPALVDGRTVDGLARSTDLPGVWVVGRDRIARRSLSSRRRPCPAVAPVKTATRLNGGVPRPDVGADRGRATSGTWRSRLLRGHGRGTGPGSKLGAVQSPDRR